MIDFQQSNLEYREIYDKIFVYSQLIPEAKLLQDIIEELFHHSDGEVLYSKWSEWYAFGDISAPTNEINFYSKNQFLNLYNSYEDKNRIVKEFLLYTRLAQSSRLAINHYIKTNKMNIPDSSFVVTPGLSRYDSDFDINNYGFAMNFHTDYNVGEWWWPGRKMLLTCTTYINNNYDGGEIVFYVNGDLCTYKPDAGDILVFPSGDPMYPGGVPYYHAVKKIENGNKYLVRSYLNYNSDINQDFWNEKEKAYGKDEWYNMVKQEAAGHNMLAFEDVFEDGQPRKVANYSDLVKKLYNL